VAFAEIDSGVAVEKIGNGVAVEKIGNGVAVEKIGNGSAEKGRRAHHSGPVSLFLFVGISGTDVRL